MSRRIVTPLLVGLAWALALSAPLFASDVRAQAATGQRDAPKNATADTKRDASAPSTAEPNHSSESSAAGPTGASAPTESRGTERAPAASPPTAEAAPDQGAAGTASVSAGAGLFEQSQSSSASTAEGSASSSAGEQSPRNFELNGYVRGDMYVGKVPSANQGEMKAGYGELALQFRAQKENFGDAYGELRLRDGLQGNTNRTIYDLREAYVNGYFGPLDLRLGKQIVVWGRADAFNPTNNITPNDLRVRSHIEDDRRVGNIGARAFLNFRPLRLEGIWMPLYVASELPVYQLPEYVTFGTTTYPNANLSNGLGAGRVHLELSEIELSASFLHGYAPLPGLAPLSYDTGENASVLITRRAYEQNVVGFDFSTTVADYLGVRGEAAFRRPVDYKNRAYAPRPDLQYVLGLDHTFGSVSIIAQYMGRYIFDWHKETDPATDPNAMGTSALPDLGPKAELNAGVAQQITTTINATVAHYNQMLFGQTERVQHMASMRVEWLTLNETLSLSALGMVNFTTKEWATNPKLAYKISDRLSTAVGVEIYRGPDGTLFAMIKDVLSAGFAELRYAF
jgi:hypothetical protein